MNERPPHDTRENIATIKIGDTIYRFDENSRVYQRDKTGRAIGGPIYAGYFKPYTITGETKMSWLIQRSAHLEYKINKKTMLESVPGWHPMPWFTQRGYADNLWSVEHRQKIVEIVQRTPASRLREIATAVGYCADDETKAQTSDHQSGGVPNTNGQRSGLSTNAGAKT